MCAAVESHYERYGQAGAADVVKPKPRADFASRRNVHVGSTIPDVRPPGPPAAPRAARADRLRREWAPEA